MREMQVSCMKARVSTNMICPEGSEEEHNGEWTGTFWEHCTTSNLFSFPRLPWQMLTKIQQLQLVKRDWASKLNSYSDTHTKEEKSEDNL